VYPPEMGLGRVQMRNSVLGNRSQIRPRAATGAPRKASAATNAVYPAGKDGV